MHHTFQNKHGAPMLEIINLGNVAFSASILGFLKKASYFLKYETAHNRLTLYGNDGDLTQELFTAEGTTREEARKLAELLGLPPFDDARKPTKWGKKVHFFRLHYDDSEEARTLYNALIDHDVPHDVIYHAKALKLEYDGQEYLGARSPIAELVDMIRSAAKKDQEIPALQKRFIIG